MLPLALVALGGCAAVVERDGPGVGPAPGSAPDATPRAEPRSKYGNPESYEVFGKRYYTLKSAAGYRERGIASWYGQKFHGRRTSSGEQYDMYQMTAAHKQLPLPTYVQVTNLDNNRTAVLKVNDRGPFHDNRIIDLSYAAALKLDIAERGTAFVEVVALDHSGRPTGRPIEAPVTKPRAPTGVYLQIGAFRDRENARRLAEKVEQSIASDVLIREIRNGGTVLHRVQLGPIMSVEAADIVVAALEGLGITTHHFVTNE